MNKNTSEKEKQAIRNALIKFVQLNRDSWINSLQSSSNSFEFLDGWSHHEDGFSIDDALDNRNNLDEKGSPIFYFNENAFVSGYDARLKWVHSYDYARL